jgi:hypothetical protein
MQIIQNQKRQHYEINGILKGEKNGERAACLKNSVHMFVEKIYKMRCLEGSGVPVLYTGRTVPRVNVRNGWFIHFSPV